MIDRHPYWNDASYYRPTPEEVEAKRQSTVKIRLPTLRESNAELRRRIARNDEAIAELAAQCSHQEAHGHGRKTFVGETTCGTCGAVVP